MHNNWSEVYDLADNYRQQQQWQPAAAAFKQAIALRPDFFWSYHHLGDVLSQLQQWQPSAVAYQRAVQLDPNFFWSWHNLGDVLFKLQQWKQSAAAYQRAVQLDPNFFWSWHNLGDVLVKLQQWDRAIAVYLQAVQIRLEHQLTYQKLGTVFKQRGNLEDSIKYYRQLISNADSSKIFSNLKTQPAIVIKIADNLAREHQAIAAIVLYYMALEIQPHRVEILQQLAQLLQQQNRLEQNIISNQQNLSSELIDRQGNNISPLSKPSHIPGQIIIKQNNPVSPEQLENLCSKVGWSPRPLHLVKQSLANSFGYVTVWHQNHETKQLIGFARAISDGTFHAVLLDIVVDPQFQNRGIGKTIVKTLVKQLLKAQVQNVTLIASPHIADFYHKLGFVSQPANKNTNHSNHQDTILHFLFLPC